MIFDSVFWKEPLLKTATYLSRVRLTESTRDKTLARIEKEVFIGFYAVRKLLDTFSVSDSTRALKVEVASYKVKREVDFLNWHRVDQIVDLTHSTLEVRDLKFLCNQFVHSYIFCPVEDAGRLAGFYFASDTERKRKCYFVNISEVVGLFRIVGRDYPSKLELRRNADGQFEAKAS